MAELIFPTGFDEKTTIAQDDMILMADSEDDNKIKKAKYSNLKGEKGDPGQDGQDGQDGTDGASIVSGGFVGDDLVFGKDDGTSVTIENAKTTLQGPQGEEGEEGPQGPAGQDGTDGQDGNGIASITSSKSGKITTVTITETNGDSESFTVSDGADGQGAGDVVGPNSSTDEDIALFDGVDGKHIKDGSKKLSDFVQTSGNQSIGGTKTFTSEPVLPSKTTTATNDGTKPATEAQVYNVSNGLGTAATKDAGTSAGNVPVLDSNGKLNTSVVPAVAITDTFTINSSSELTSLSAAEKGDVAICPSELKTYILYAEPYSVSANWKLLPTPTGDVTSVNGKTGVVTLNADDISDSTTTNKFVTATDKSTWSGKQDALTLPSTPTSGHLVTWGANNKTLADGGAVPTGVPAVGTNGQVLTVVSGAAAWANAPATGIQNDTTGTTTTVTAIRAGTEAEYALITPNANTIYHIY